MVSGLSAPSHRKMSDQFHLCAHDLRGHPRLTPRALELGMATALLGDLVVDGYLKVVDDRVQLRERGWNRLQCPRLNQQPTIVQWVLEKISGSPTTDLRGSITEIAPRAPQLIARHLEADGLVRRVQPPWFALWRTTPRYAPMDLNGPNHLGDHLWTALQGRSSLSVGDVFLAGLLKATQLHRTVITELPHLDDLIDHQVRALTEPTHSQTHALNASLSALILSTQRLVDQAALAQTF